MFSFICNRPESIKISEEKSNKIENFLVERFCMGIRPYSTVIDQRLRPFIQECISLGITQPILKYSFFILLFYSIEAKYGKFMSITYFLVLTLFRRTSKYQLINIDLNFDKNSLSHYHSIIYLYHFVFLFFALIYIYI